MTYLKEIDFLGSTHYFKVTNQGVLHVNHTANIVNVIPSVPYRAGTGPCTPDEFTNAFIDVQNNLTKLYNL